MREMWELPGLTAGKRAIRVGLALGLVWAVTAVPLSVWLALRTPVVQPPATRALSVMETSAVRSGAQALSTTPVSLSFTVTSAAARLQVDEAVDVARGVAHGTVSSNTQSAELLVVGDRVLLKGSPTFWSMMGVPTSDPGWIEVGDLLGVIPFPLSEAVTALTPGQDSVLDTAALNDATMTFHNSGVVADFTATGVVSLSFADRTAKVSRPQPLALAALAAAPGDGTTGTAKLSGTSGALTVAPAPAPPPPPPTTP